MWCICLGLYHLISVDYAQTKPVKTGQINSFAAQYVLESDVSQSSIQRMSWHLDDFFVSLSYMDEKWNVSTWAEISPDARTPASRCAVCSMSLLLFTGCIGGHQSDSRSAVRGCWTETLQHPRLPCCASAINRKLYNIFPDLFDEIKSELHSETYSREKYASITLNAYGIHWLEYFC